MKKLTTDADELPNDDEEALELDLSQIPTEQEEVKTYMVRLQVYTTSRESSRIALGEKTAQEYQHIIAILNAPFETLAQSKTLVLTDAKNVTHIFNTNNVTHIEVEAE